MKTARAIAITTGILAMSSVALVTSPADAAPCPAEGVVVEGKQVAPGMVIGNQVPAAAQTVYIDVRSTGSVWVYVEDNKKAGLQRGYKSGHPTNLGNGFYGEVCNEPNPDLLII